MKKVWKYLRWLKRDFPLQIPVIVRTYPEIKDHSGHDLHGTCDLVNGVFRICLSRKYDEASMVETLWHEWTHCLVWPRCKYRHTRRFSDQYFAIYRKYLDD